MKLVNGLMAIEKDKSNTLTKNRLVGLHKQFESLSLDSLRKQHFTNFMRKYALGKPWIESSAVLFYNS